MDQKHLPHEEMQAFTEGRLDGKRKHAVVEHLQQCGACHAQQAQMAMTAVFARIKEIEKHNEQWTCSDPFWGPPYPLAPVTPPPSVLYLWKDVGDELREEADSFDALVRYR